jgi:hypothetical protein
MASLQQFGTDRDHIPIEIGPGECIVYASDQFDPDRKKAADIFVLRYILSQLVSESRSSAMSPSRITVSGTACHRAR